MRARPSPRRGASPDRAEVARLAHALSDETRLSILERLRNGEECVCNLTGLLESGQSRLSFHLKVLKDAGLVRARRDGRWMHYAIEPSGLSAVLEYVERLEPGRRKP